jgi:hypothetical protein
LIIAALSLAPLSPLFADDNDGPLSGTGVDGGFQQPQIIVRPTPAGKIEEYRIAGHLYMIKVTPEKGPGYYLVDSDGDGNFDTRKGGLNSQIAVPQWVLKRWR